MNLIHSQRIGALLAAVSLVAAGCGKSSSNKVTDGGVVGPEGLHVAVVLPEALDNGGPAGFSTTVSGITVTATLDGKLVTPDQVQWSIKDSSGQWDPPGAVAPSPATGATTSFQIPDFETLRQAANAWLRRAYGSTDPALEYVQAPSREQLLSFGPMQVQAMSYQVIAAVKVGTRTASASAVVSPVTVSSGVNPLPLGMMVVGNAPAGGTYAWNLAYLPTDAAKGTAFGALPAGVALQGVDTKNPYFVPTASGLYQLQNGTNTPIVFRVSTYHGVGRKDSDPGSDGVACAGCHAGTHALAQFGEWQTSAHFAVPGTSPAVSLFQYGIDGGLGSRYDESCASCHVVGFSKVPSAINGGFDDVADAAGWNFPVPAAGNFAAMPAGLAHRAGVQCESCHGPLEPADHSSVNAAGGYGIVAPVASKSAGICMTCHDGMQDGNQGPQWAASGHSNTQLAIDDATVENRGSTYSNGSVSGVPHCARCHAAEGFALYLEQQQGRGCTTALTLNQDATGTAGYIRPQDTSGACFNIIDSTTATAAIPYYTKMGLTKAKVHSQTCQVCHDPHTTTLRLTGDTGVTAAGFSVSGAGAGALCIVCHNSRVGAVLQGTNVLSKFTAPHTASQGDIFAGRNAFLVDELVAGQAANDLPWKSKHAATADACATCHVLSVPEDLKGQFHITGTNHTFQASMEVCANCHSATQVAAFEATRESTEAKLVQLRDLIHKTIMDRLNLAGFAAPTRYDVTTDGAITAPTDTTIAAGLVTAVELYESHGAPAVKLTFSSGTPFATTLANVKQFADPSKGFFAVASGTPAVAGADQTLARVIYNYLLIHGGAAGGVHNFDFSNVVLDKSIAALSPQ